MWRSSINLKKNEIYFLNNKINIIQRTCNYNNFLVVRMFLDHYENSWIFAGDPFKSEGFTSDPFASEDPFKNAFGSSSTASKVSIERNRYGGYLMISKG